MKNLLVISAILLLSLSACGPSEEKRMDAKEVLDGTLSIISTVNVRDSEYVHCMQYLIREIQSPDLKKNKKKLKAVSDSMNLLEICNDSLQTAVADALKAVEKLRLEKPGFDLLDATDTLLSKYSQISGEVYSDINLKMRKVSLPVKDGEYTVLLKLSFRADSVLNEAVNNFNNESASFSEKYRLKDLK
ncbi:hypothetical protein SDC9_52244 [bioreactor metagenome]|uniref:Lipoprotein n=1 Tax=bioreactor metagenome TaxID=1076179 RepID=A0A644WQI5_9ZZZZ